MTTSNKKKETYNHNKKSIKPLNYRKNQATTRKKCRPKTMDRNVEKLQI